MVKQHDKMSLKQFRDRVSELMRYTNEYQRADLFKKIYKYVIGRDDNWTNLGEIINHANKEYYKTKGE